MLFRALHMWTIKFDRIDNTQHILWKHKLFLYESLNVIAAWEWMEKSVVYLPVRKIMHVLYFDILWNTWTHDNHILKAHTNSISGSGRQFHHHEGITFYQITNDFCPFYDRLTFSAAWRVLIGACCKSGGRYLESLVWEGDSEISTPPSEWKQRDSGVTTKISLATALFSSTRHIVHFFFQNLAFWLVQYI